MAKKPPKQTKALVPLQDLEVALGGDRDLVLFFLAWLKNNRNATEAYLELNPNVTRESAAVMGSNKLRNIKIDVIAAHYDLGTDTYFSSLQEGLKATRFETTSIELEDDGPGGKRQIFEKKEVPDFHARRKYHEALGKLLGFEGKGDGNTNIGISIKIENYGEKK